MKNISQTHILMWVIVLLVCIIWAGAFYLVNLEKEKKVSLEQNKIPFEWYSKMMEDHCKMMPEMQGCEPYLELLWKKEFSWEKKKNKQVEEQEEDISSLPIAKETQIVELKDGDSYTMEVTKIKKEVWNTQIEMFAYNGSVPWPVIKVAKNSKITLKFINKVQNLETTLHSHWLRWDDANDWVPIEMMGKQKIMKYGDEFEYKLTFPDEGIYWYHPHVREDLQQEKWMYGNFLVKPNNPDYWSKVNREETLILDDILLENSKIETLHAEFANYVLMGRYGNTMLINWDSAYNLKAKKWEIIRMYFTNVSNTRPYNIKIPWAKIKLVWGDNGKYEKETFIENFVIAPAERYIVEVYFPDSGTFEIQNNTPVSKYTLWKIEVNEEKIETSYKKEFETLRENKEMIAEVQVLQKYFDKKADKSIILTLWHKWMQWWMWSMWGMWMKNMMWDHASNDGIEWEDSMQQMNKNSNTDMLEWKIVDNETAKENMNIFWSFKKWDKIKVKIFNDPNSMHPMQHPIHFHGQRFLVISRDWVKQTNLVWKDTSLVKSWETVEILVDMTNPWLWMSHCHIAEHLSAGMMMHFEVKE